MTETNGNGELEKKVRHIIIGEGKFVWGIVLATAAIVGAFMSVQVELAKISSNIASLDESIKNHVTITSKDQERITILETNQKIVLQKLKLNQ